VAGFRLRPLRRHRKPTSELSTRPLRLTQASTLCRSFQAPIREMQTWRRTAGAARAGRLHHTPACATPGQIVAARRRVCGHHLASRRASSQPEFPRFPDSRVAPALRSASAGLKAGATSQTCTLREFPEGADGVAIDLLRRVMRLASDGLQDLAPCAGQDEVCAQLPEWRGVLRLEGGRS